MRAVAAVIISLALLIAPSAVLADSVLTAAESDGIQALVDHNDGLKVGPPTVQFEAVQGTDTIRVSSLDGSDSDGPITLVCLTESNTDGGRLIGCTYAQ